LHGIRGLSNTSEHKKKAMKKDENTNGKKGINSTALSMGRDFRTKHEVYSTFIRHSALIMHETKIIAGKAQNYDCWQGKKIAKQDYYDREIALENLKNRILHDDDFSAKFIIVSDKDAFVTEEFNKEYNRIKTPVKIKVYDFI
jgi:hypothetical protein